MNDLNLLARVFIRYRSGLDIALPECQEIIDILNRALENGDITTMTNSQLLYQFSEPKEVAAPKEMKSRARKQAPIVHDTNEETEE